MKRRSNLINTEKFKFWKPCENSICFNNETLNNNLNTEQYFEDGIHSTHRYWTNRDFIMRDIFSNALEGIEIYVEYNKINITLEELFPFQECL